MARSTSRSRRRAAPAGALAALVLLAGCAQEVGASEVEQSIREAMGGQQVMIDSVECPSGLPAEEGAVIICPVTVFGVDDAGDPIDRIRVRVTAVEGTEVRYRLEPLAEGVPDDAEPEDGPLDDTDTTDDTEG
jgi:hypothetical protein